MLKNPIQSDTIALLTQPQKVLEVFLCHVALKGRLANVATLRVSELGQPGRPFSVFSL